MDIITLFSGMGSLLISQQSTERTSFIFPILSGAHAIQAKIQLCQMKNCLPDSSEWSKAAEGE